jgi:hypothetical protein
LGIFKASRPNLDRHGAEVLDRLSSDERASQAFADLDLELSEARVIIVACIEAELMARTFQSRLDVEKRMLGNGGKPGKLDELERSVVALRAFLDEINRERVDPLSAVNRYSPDDVGAVKQGLYVLTNAISARRQVAKETLLRLGSTRKSKGKAGETAAIGWIGEAVEKVCGQPRHGLAATIAEVTLDCAVSVDRLRGAVQTRRRPWRE